MQKGHKQSGPPQDSTVRASATTSQPHVISHNDDGAMMREPSRQRFHRPLFFLDRQIARISTPGRMQQRLLRSDSINVTDKADACWRLLTRNLNLLLSPNFSTSVVRNRYGAAVALNVALVRKELNNEIETFTTCFVSCGGVVHVAASDSLKQ